MPTLSPGYSNLEAQLLMQLSSLAYVDETARHGETIQQQQARMKSDIDAALKGGPPYLAGWQVVWGPALSPDRANMLYIAGNTSLNQYAVAVRGTDWSFILDWIEDFAALLLLVPYPALNAGKIAAGTLVGMQVLEGLNFLPFLSTIPGDAAVYVTGHSLGGCLASAIAPIISTQFGSSGNVKVYTFAAPSPGDHGFKSYFNHLFGEHSMAFRVYDTLDAVPNAWTTLATIETYYAGFYPCPDDLKSLINFAISKVGHEYATVGTNHSLTGHIIWPFGEPEKSPEIDPVGDALFLWQVAQQHSHVNYLSLLGAQFTTPSVARVKGMLSRMNLAHVP